VSSKRRLIDAPPAAAISPTTVAAMPLAAARARCHLQVVYAGAGANAADFDLIASLASAVGALQPRAAVIVISSDKVVYRASERTTDPEDSRRSGCVCVCMCAAQELRSAVARVMERAGRAAPRFLSTDHMNSQPERAAAIEAELT